MAALPRRSAHLEGGSAHLEGGHAFVSAAELARSARAVRRDLSQLWLATRSAVRERREIRDWLRDLPGLPVELSTDENGDAVLEGLRVFQPWPVRYRAVAAIALPDTAEAYLRGRAMQAARTNRSRALRHGLSVCRATTHLEAEGLLTRMINEGPFLPFVAADLRRLLAHGPRRAWFVLDPTGRPVGAALAAVDGRVAQLAALQIAADTPDASAARFLLSTEIVHDLVDDSPDHLLADSMLLAAPGVVYLQRRLGFRPVNLAVSRRHAPAVPLSRARASRA